MDVMVASYTGASSVCIASVDQVLNYPAFWIRRNAYLWR